MVPLFVRRSSRRRWLALCAASALAGPGLTQSIADQQEQRDRAQREAQARQQQQHTPDVRQGDDPRVQDVHRTDLPGEATCFPISAVYLDGEHSRAFGFARRHLKAYAGRCIGQRGIDLIVRRLSDMIIDHGYVTSRVGVAPQDLGSGELHLMLVAGRLRNVRFANGAPHGNWHAALPMRPGDVLNLRDIEQALEQFKRVASQDVDIDIAPGDAPGESDLVITVRRSRPWHVVATLDNSGSRGTGRWQAGMNASVDNPLGLNDVLSVGYNHDVFASVGHGTRGQSASYSVPWGHWLLSTSVYDYRYHQTVEGSLQSFTSSGKSRTADFNLQRLVHRTRQGKTSLELRVGRRWAHSFIEDAELVSQRRNVTTADLSLVQRQYLGAAQLDLRLTHRRGVGWFGGQRDSRSLPRGSPTFSYRLALLDASISVPFQWAHRALQWSSELRVQQSHDALYGSEFMGIGGRYSVRGFDGEQTLAGERGWYWRNALTVPLGTWPAAIYFGVDGGRVGGASTRDLPQRSLLGDFIGLRASAGRLSVDVFAGWALRGARVLQTMRPATGIGLVYQI